MTHNKVRDIYKVAYTSYSAVHLDVNVLRVFICNLKITKLCNTYTKLEKSKMGMN